MGLFDAIGDVVSGVADVVSDVVDTVGDVAGVVGDVAGALGPIASIAGIAFPPLGIAASAAGLLTGVVGDAVNSAAKQLSDECGLPRFLLGDIAGLVDSVLTCQKPKTDARCDQAVGEHLGRQFADFGNDFAKTIADLAQGIMEIGTEETKSAKGGGSWLVAIAKAMGEAAGKHADKLVSLSKEIEAASGDDKAGAVTGLQAEFQAEAQMFSMLQNAFSTAIKSIGEGMSTMARK